MFLAKYWWLLATVVLYVITDQITNHPLLKSIAVVPFIARIVLYFIDKVGDDKEIRYKIYPRALEYVKGRYINKIKAALERSDYSDDVPAVIDYCIGATKVFDK